VGEDERSARKKLVLFDGIKRSLEPNRSSEKVSFACVWNTSEEQEMNVKTLRENEITKESGRKRFVYTFVLTITGSGLRDK
jgi:hypothetical protein